MQQIVSLLLLPIYTRFLTPHDYGIKELVGLSIDIISILIATAISGAFYRFYFEYDSERERNELLSTSFIAIGSFGLVAISLIAFATKLMASAILDDPGLYHYFLIALASLWFRTMNHITFNYLKAKQKSLLFISISFVSMVMTISLNIYFVCFLKIGVLGILIGNLITVMLISLVMTTPLILKIGLHFSIAKFKEMLRFGLPLIPSQFGAFIVHLSDRFFIKEYCSIADTGLYSLGYRFGAIPGNFISGPFNQIFQPRRLELYKQDNSEYIFGRIFTYFLFLMIIAGLIVSVLTKDILMIMADERFWSAYQIVPIIVLATTIFSFHYHLNMGIIISKKTKYLAYINASNGLIVLILNFLLIPKYGVFGAAYATLLAFIYKISLTYYFSSKFFKISFEHIRIAKLIIVAVIIYAFLHFLSINSAYISICVKLFIIIISFPLILYMTLFFTDNEKHRISDFLRKKFKTHTTSI